MISDEESAKIIAEIESAARDESSFFPIRDYPGLGAEFVESMKRKRIEQPSSSLPKLARQIIREISLSQRKN